MIKAFNRSHVEAVARLHAQGLTGLLSELGPSAIKAYYRGAADSPDTIGYVATSDGGVNGFVLGSMDPARLRSDIVRRNLAGTISGMLAGIIRHPAALAGVLRSVFGGTAPSVADTPELIYLAVDPAARSAGFGTQLVDAFGQEVARSGGQAFVLSVDVANESALRFYARQGFVETCYYREFGIDRARLRKEL